MPPASESLFSRFRNRVQPLRNRVQPQHLGQRLLTRGVSACIGLGTLFFGTSASVANIVLDGSTTGLIIYDNGCQNLCTISGGELRGGNLFHSFSEFVIPSGGDALLTTPFGFLPSSVESIFIRVTGSATDIDGSFRVSSLYLNSPDIYFLSPKGISIGGNARLDYPGNFLFSTAERLNFDSGGVFDATDPAPNAKPPLTISGLNGLPNILQLGNVPGAINFLSSGLTEPDFIPQTHQHQFSIVGRDVNFDGVDISTPGTLYIASVDNNQVVNLNFPASGDEIDFTYGSPTVFRDIGLINSTLSSGSLSNLDDAGSIELIGQNLQLRSNSLISALTDVAGGDISLDFTGLVELETASRISTRANTASAIAGEISVNSGEMRLAQGSLVNSFSTTSGGDISVNVARHVELDSQSKIFTQTTAITANSGDISISADSLNLLDQSLISTSTNAGSGEIGLAIVGDVLIEDLSRISTLPSSTATSGSNISLDAGGRVRLLNQGIISTQPNTNSANFGLIDISSANLELIQQGEISTTAGAISVNSGEIQLAQSSQIESSTDTSGGDITLNANNGPVTLDTLSTITTQATTLTASAGNITMSAGSLSLLDQNEIVTQSNSGDGEINLAIAGDVLIEDSSRISTFASDPTASGSNITLNANGRVALDSQGKITTQATTATANAGNINLSAANLSLLKLNEISTQTNSGGGDIILLVLGDVQVNDSSLVATTAKNNAAIAGNITLASDSLTVDGGGRIISGFNGFTSGNLDIDVDEVNINENGEIATVAHDPSNPGSGASAGDISIDGTHVSIQSEGKIYTLTEDLGGDLKFGLTGDLSNRDSGSQIAVRAVGTSDAGDLTLAARNLRLANQSEILSQTDQGGGTLNLALGEDIFLDTASSIASKAQEGSGASAGGLSLTGRNLSIDGDNSIIFSLTENGGGAINLDLRNDVTLSNGAKLGTFLTNNGDAIDGDVGSIRLQAINLSQNNNADIITETAGGQGNIDINLLGGDLAVIGGNLGNSEIITKLATTKGAAGDIAISANNVTFDQGLLLTETDQPGGDIDVNATGTIQFDQSQIRLSSPTGTGHTGNLSLTSQSNLAPVGILLSNTELLNEANNTGGNVALTAQGEVELQDGSFISIDSSGANGNLTVTASAFRSNGITANNDVLLEQGTLGNLSLPTEVTGFDPVASQVERTNANSELLPNPIPAPEIPPPITVIPPSPPSPVTLPPVTPPPVTPSPTGSPVNSPVVTPANPPTTTETNGEPSASPDETPSEPKPTNFFRQPTNLNGLASIFQFYGYDPSSEGYTPWSCSAARVSRFQVSGRGGMGSNPFSLNSSSTSLNDLGQWDEGTMSSTMAHSSRLPALHPGPSQDWLEAQTWQRDSQGKVQLVAPSSLALAQTKTQGCKSLR